MSSIRRKLFVQIGSLIVILLLLLFLANTFLLEKIYTYGVKDELADIYMTVNEIDQEAYSPQVLYDLVITSSIFVELVIIDRENNQLYLPANPSLGGDDPRPEAFKAIQLPKNDKTILKEEVVDDNSRYVWLVDPRTDLHFLAYEGTLDNGLLVEMRVPLVSIQQNVYFFNQFILVSGLILLVITMIVANYIAKYFTKPILNMNDVTSSIKDMDFSQVCQVQSNDEIGQLAENINEMSYSLEANISELSISNIHLKEEIEERLKIDEQRKALLNNVSHELKTPLSLVQGYSEGLKVNLHKNPEKTDFYCDVIMDEAKKMDILVSELLDINRIQFGDFPLHKEETDAYDLIHYVTRKYEDTLAEAGVLYTEDLSAIDNSDIKINVDTLRCEQVITNLLNNALAYVDNIGKIALTCGLEENHLILSVSNSHEEVAAEELTSWWQSFYKADKARTRENGGYGLGLSFIKAVQEADGNNYSVEYQEGMIVFKVKFDLV